MSLSSDDATNAAWNNDAQQQQQSQAGDYTSTLGNTAGTVQGGLSGLFRLSSMTSDNRNLAEASDALKTLQEYYDAQKKASISDLQRKIIPNLQEFTSAVSPVLPGIGLDVVVGDTMYVAGFLFSKDNLTINSERIDFAGNGVFGASQVSIPLTPVQYANGDFYKRLRDHYQRKAEDKNVKNVSVVSLRVIDLEMLKHEEAGDIKDQPRNNALDIAAEWEEALLVKSTLEMVAQKIPLPNPFQNAQQPYDKGGAAEARVTAISGRVTKGRTLTADNMEVTATTIFPNGNNGNYNRDFNVNSKDICRVTGAVSLTAVSFEDWQRYMMTSRPDQLAQLQSFMGGMAGGYGNGYRPLRPVITMGEVTAGEMMGYNGGLYPFFYGLYLLMCTNNHYTWAEAIRKACVGARGSLADMELRIQQMLSSTPWAAARTQNDILDVKKLSDTDFVSNWIRMNVSPHATFQVNVLPAGPHASIHNFLQRLADTSSNHQEVMTVVKLIDAMSNNKMSATIEENLKKGGWTPTKPILLPTGMIAVNGRGRLGDKSFNTQEMDEMMISHIKGKNNLAGIEAFLGTQYGTDPREGFKQRCQKLRLEMTGANFSTDPHINGFAQPYIWAPDFMAALGQSLDGIGQLNVANNIGSYRSSNLVFAPGIGLATMAAAGSNNPNQPSLGMAYGNGVSFIKAARRLRCLKKCVGFLPPRIIPPFDFLELGMIFPELTPSNALAVEALTKFSAEALNPLPYFQSYADKFGKSLADNPAYSRPLYHDFEDYNYLHDTSRHDRVYLNDFDFNLEDHQEEVARLTRMEFSGNSFDTVASCGCDSPRRLRGNYLLGSGKTCPDCGNKAQVFLDRGEDVGLWLRCPEGVKKFINPGFLSSFFNGISIGSPKVCIPRYFVDPIYRKQVKKQTNTTRVIINNMLEELQIHELDLNSFYDNADALMEWILVGNGRRYFSKPNQEAQELYALYLKYKNIAFCDYIKVPSRYSTVLEKSGKEIYSYAHQPATAALYLAIADTAKSSSVGKLSEAEAHRNVEIVGKNIVLLADQYRKVNNPKGLFHKPAINRKHVVSGALPFTGRSVITSQTGIIDTDQLLVPWKMCLSMLEIHITSFLYRRGFTPYKAQERINLAAYYIDPLIDEFFRDMEESRKCLIQSGRNPSIEYLSLRCFFLKVNRDLEDESIKIPILACKQQNADFDGDNEYVVMVFDNESKARAYGGFGHHQVLDKNVPFKVGDYAGQTATNLMNLNTLMKQTELIEL